MITVTIIVNLFFLYILYVTMRGIISPKKDWKIEEAWQYEHPELIEPSEKDIFWRRIESITAFTFFFILWILTNIGIWTE